MSYLFLYLYTQASCLGSQGCSLPHKEQCHRCTSTTSHTHHVPRGKFSAWAACPALQTCGECFTQAEIRPCCTPRIVLWSCAGKASRTAVRPTAEQHVLRWWRDLVLSWHLKTSSSITLTFSVRLAPQRGCAHLWWLRSKLLRTCREAFLLLRV